MKIIDVKQGTEEWLRYRAGIPTASEFDQLISPGKWEIREGEMAKKYLGLKLAEWWLNGPLPGATFWNSEQGHLLEAEARPTFTIETGIRVVPVGFVTTDDGLVGCSPDGLIGDYSGLECKAPEAHTHTAYLVAGKLPPEYTVQVQGAMYVTGRQVWYFYSYRRGFPNLCLEVAADPLCQEIIQTALEKFLGKFNQAKGRLVDLNNGPSPYHKKKRYDNAIVESAAVG